MGNLFGKSFIYNNIPSEIYGLILCELDGSDVSEGDSSGAEVYSNKIPGSKEYVLYGVERKDPISFSITIASEKELDSLTRSNIKKWLLGQKSYKKLYIVGQDTQSIYYNCIFTNMETVFLGNAAYAFKLTAVCDSPYQHENPEVKTYSFASTPNTISIISRSDISDYIYPIVMFKISSAGGTFSIKNTTDNERLFQFTTLSGSETITIDNQRQIITSDLSIYRLQNFNKYWFRLLPGNNSLVVTGRGDLTVTIPIYRNI